MKANCELNHNFTIWYDWLVLCLLLSVLFVFFSFSIFFNSYYCWFCFFSSVFCFSASVVWIFNYYDWCVLWLEAVSLNFRCGGVSVGVDIDVDVSVFVAVFVIIVVGTNWIPLLRFVRIMYFSVPKGCLQISFFTV